MSHTANQSEPVRSQTDYPEDEIELIDLLRVIWKWKYLIIGGTAICAIVAAIISLNMAKVYSVDTILEPGILNIINEGVEANRRVYIDSPENIKALIDVGSFENQILKYLVQLAGSQDIPEKIQFKTSIPKKSNALKVSYETSNIELGLLIVNYLNKLLSDKYSQFVKYYRKEIIIQLKLRNSEREKFLISQKSIKINLKNFEKRIKDLSSEIELIIKNTDNLIGDQQKFISKPRGENGILTALLYSNTIQQNMSLINNYKNQLNSYELKLESEKQKLTESEENIKNIMDQIGLLEFKRDSVQNIQILKPPTNSPYPIKPNKRLNVMLATMVGLFMMVFMSFLLEYISKNKKEKTSAQH